MTLRDPEVAIDLGDAASRLQHGLVGTEPHGAAEIAAGAALLELVAAHPLGHQADHRLGGRSELGGGCFFDPGEIAGRFDAGHLHAEADAEKRNLAGPGEGGGADRELRTALGEAYWH